MTQREFTVRYSESQVRNSVKRYFLYLLRREFSWQLCLVLVLLVGFVLYELSTGPVSWLDGAIGAVVLLLALFFFILYRTHLKHGLERLRLMKVPTATFTINDDSLTVSSDGGSSTIPWHQFATILEYDDFWIFVLKQRAIFTMPLGGVDESALLFIRAQVSSKQG